MREVIGSRPQAGVPTVQTDGPVVSGPTPGEWVSPGWVPTWAYIPVRSPYGLICSVYPMADSVHGRGWAEANARIIAAAPKMLAALQGIADDDDASVSLADQRSRWDARMDEARAAIAKATGAGQ